MGQAILWGYGYMCGRDESFIQRLDEALIKSLIFNYILIVKDNPSLNLVQATQEVIRLSEALKKPAAPARN